MASSDSDNKSLSRMASTQPDTSLSEQNTYNQHKPKEADRHSSSSSRTRARSKSPASKKASRSRSHSRSSSPPGAECFRQRNTRPWVDNGLTAKDYQGQLEPIHRYNEGGHHPMHLRQSVGHYQIVHKLEIGRVANVWLCRDTGSPEPKYYAVKILTADASAENSPEFWIGNYFGSVHGKTVDVNLLLPMEYLEADEENGKHMIIVYPVVGPNILFLYNMRTRSEGVNTLRKMSYQIAEAVAYLHKIGICHGDIETANILAGVSGIQGRSEDELFKDIGRPDFMRVTTSKGDLHRKLSAPQYLVHPVDWNDLRGNDIAITGKAYLMDFTSAFVRSEPPKYLYPNLCFASPEWLLEKEVGEGSDIWGLGCSLFEIRTGVKLFREPLLNPPVYLRELCLILGKMPERWWDNKWEARKYIFEDESNDKDQVVALPQMIIPFNQARSIRERVKTCWDDIDPATESCVPQAFSERELDLFVELMEKIFKWDPKKRLTAREIADHPYFKLDQNGT